MIRTRKEISYGKKCSFNLKHSIPKAHVYNKSSDSEMHGQKLTAFPCLPLMPTILKCIVHPSFKNVRSWDPHGLQDSKSIGDPFVEKRELTDSLHEGLLSHRCTDQLPDLRELAYHVVWWLYHWESSPLLGTGIVPVLVLWRGWVSQLNMVAESTCEDILISSNIWVDGHTKEACPLQHRWTASNLWRIWMEQRENGRERIFFSFAVSQFEWWHSI